MKAQKLFDKSPVNRILADILMMPAEIRLTKAE